MPSPNKEKGRKPIKGENNKTYAVIIRDDKLENDKLLKGDDRKAALIIKMMNVSNDRDI